MTKAVGTHGPIEIVTATAPLQLIVSANMGVGPVSICVLVAEATIVHGTAARKGVHAMLMYMQLLVVISVGIPNRVVIVKANASVVALIA